MTLHPQARAALESSSGDPRVWEVGIEESRARARVEAARLPREPVAHVEDVDADGVPCRLYEPEGCLDGVVLHLHGGGFVFHDVDVHDAAARCLANRSRMRLLSVDYRLAPEHPFPAARDDVDTVLRWCAEQADRGDPRFAGPTYLHGDSSGGNLALVAALRNPGRLRALALTYPFLDPSAAGESYTTAAEGFDPAEAAWYWQQYARTADDLTDPDAAPLLSHRLSTLPPTLVVTAEHDPLRDEGEVLVARLADAGVSTVGIRFLGQLHGFWRHPEVFDAAGPLTGTIAGFLLTHHP
jgi:acetyl esterase